MKKHFTKKPKIVASCFCLIDSVKGVFSVALMRARALGRLAEFQNSLRQQLAKMIQSLRMHSVAVEYVRYDQRTTTQNFYALHGGDPRRPS